MFWNLWSPLAFWGSPNPTPPPSPPSTPVPTYPPPSSAGGSTFPPGSLGDGLSSSAIVYRSIVNPAAYFEKYGFPGPIHDLGSRQEFISCYDRRMRNPAWVIEHITRESLQKDQNHNGNRDNSVFKEDEAVPTKFKNQLRDYFRSGYDRGHQAPAADAKFNQDAMDQTFYLTNICPQVGMGFNRDYWAHFEHFIRTLTDTYPSVRIVTGPLYLPKRDPDGKWRVSYEMIGNPPNIAVPTHFFKVVIGEYDNNSNNNNSYRNSSGISNVAVGAFVIPNEPIDNTTSLKSFYVPLESVERSSGFELISDLKVPVNKRKDLCQEVKCEIIVRAFQKALPAPKQTISIKGS